MSGFKSKPYYFQITPVMEGKWGMKLVFDLRSSIYQRSCSEQRLSRFFDLETPVAKPFEASRAQLSSYLDAIIVAWNHHHSSMDDGTIMQIAYYDSGSLTRGSPLPIPATATWPRETQRVSLEHELTHFYLS